jgi:ERCC4-type nuclease
MIRIARAMLDSLLTYAHAATGAPFDDYEQVIGECLDAAEVALAPDLEPAAVLVDTREQRPFAPFLWQKGKRVYLPLERFMLTEGDYSALGLEDFVRIERKSTADLDGSLFGTSCDALGESAPNQARLRGEFIRLQKYPRRYFVIEGHQRDLVEYIRRSERRVDATAAIQLVESMGFDYDVPVRWCTNREAAEWFVGYVLSRAHTQATSATEAKKAVKRGLALPWAYDIAKAVTKAADAIREGAAP